MNSSWSLWSLWSWLLRATTPIAPTVSFCLESSVKRTKTIRYTGSYHILVFILEYLKWTDA
jgi:hypothetical protein